MTEKNRSTAAFLALLLGLFGVHKFYLGRPVAGLVYLMFFWSGIPGVVALVEGILYLVQSDADFNRTYNLKLAYEAPKFLSDPVDMLRRLEALRQEGLISDEEFEAKRRQLIDRIG